MQFEHSAWWLIPILIAGVSASYYIYKTDKSIKNAPRFIKTLLISLRALALIAITILLLSPFIKLEKSELLRPIILLLQDNTKSIVSSTTDTAFIKRKYPQVINQLVADIRETYDVHHLHFGKTISEASDSALFTESETDYSTIFEELQNRYAEENIGGIILATDGNQTQGEALTYAARRLQKSSPYYIVALGDSVKKSDVYINNINHNEYAYVNKISQIAVDVQWHGISDSKTNVRLFSKDSLVSEKSISFGTQRGSTSLLFSFTPSKTGIYPMRVVIEPTASDRIVENNSKEFFFTVLESKKKIIFYAEQIHPDMGAFHRAFKTNTNYDVQVVKSIDAIPFDKCDLLVFSGTDKREILYKKLKEKAIPRLWLRGVKSVGNGSYTTGLDYKGSGRSTDAVSVHLNSTFNTFNVSEDFEALSDRAMPVIVPFGTYTISDPRTEIIAYQKIKGIETNKPLIGLLKQDQFKQVYLLGHGYWHWRVQCFIDNGNFDAFDRFANTVSEYLLAHTGKKRFTLSYPKVASETEQLQFVGQVLDESLQLTNKAEVTMVLKDTLDQTKQYIFNASQNNYNLTIHNLPNGKYTFTAKAQLGDKTFYESGLIRVAESNAELVFSSANLKSLSMMFDEHTGKLYSPNELSQLKSDVLKTPAQTVYVSHTEFFEFIDIMWYLLSVICLLIAEWVIRKYYGAL